MHKNAIWLSIWFALLLVLVATVLWRFVPRGETTPAALAGSRAHRLVARRANQSSGRTRLCAARRPDRTCKLMAESQKR